MRVVTSDLQEAIGAVSHVYCPHDVKVLESNRGMSAVLEAWGAGRRQLVSLRHAAPVKIDAGTFKDLLLFMSCVDGAAEAVQGRHSVQWGQGRRLPLSPNISSQLTFDRRFWQIPSGWTRISSKPFAHVSSIDRSRCRCGFATRPLVRGSRRHGRRRAT